MSELLYKGKRYRLGSGVSPLELSASQIAPAQTPHGWEEVAHPLEGVSRAYARAYLQHPGRLAVLVTASVEEDHKRWLHVSVSHRGGRLPTWREMAAVKTVFCGAESTAYEVHPPTSKHVAIAEVLHLWVCLDGPVTPDFTRGGETI